MSQNAAKFARTGLQWSLGLILAYESARLAFTSAYTSTRTHLPRPILIAIALIELAGAVLFLLPSTLRLGSYLLLTAFGVAALLHVLHGQPDVGYLVIYAMAVLTVTTQKG